MRTEIGRSSAADGSLEELVLRIRQLRGDGVGSQVETDGEELLVGKEGQLMLGALRDCRRSSLICNVEEEWAVALEDSEVELFVGFAECGATGGPCPQTYSSEEWQKTESHQRSGHRASATETEL